MVDFPEPESPMMTKISPRLTSKLTFRRRGNMVAVAIFSNVPETSATTPFRPSKNWPGFSP